MQAALRRLAGRSVDAEELAWQARLVLRQVGPTSEGVVAEVLRHVVVTLLGRVIAGGWDPTDLADRDSRALAVLLGLAALLVDVPLLQTAAAAAARRTGPSEAEHPKWRQVRTLLAKAESTGFGPEAEALVAKAQELVSRYALERLMEAEGADGPGRGLRPTSRRLWLDRPCVRAEAVLVDEVARVNHCRSALEETSRLRDAGGSRARPRRGRPPRHVTDAAG